MKRILVLLILLPFMSNAQTEFKNISGKWQEQYRTKKKGKPVDFTDTLRLEIRTEGFMMLRHSEGATLTGQAEINGNKLTLLESKFTIIESGSDSLVLNDLEGNHVFVRIPEFSNSPVTKKIPGAEKGKVDVSSNFIKGKWTVYKKTDPSYKASTFYLKSLEVKQEKGSGNFVGEATFNNTDSVYFDSATVKIENQTLIISTTKQQFQAKMIKSDGDEIILEDGLIHYFMKQFGKKD